MASPEAIEALKAAFPSDQVSLPGTEAYKRLNSSYLCLLQSEIMPAAIFQPKTKEDVAKFLQIVKDDGATQFAICGNGQQPAPGCSNIEEGITLNLGLLTGVELNADGTVSIGAGECWGSVVRKLAPEGLAVAGGRTGRGGIGGLALAGGLSYFSSREGFISDNILGFEIVLASGEIVQADASSNPDLWRALRGGGNNFGVVTKYHMATFKQGPIWGGNVLYPASGFSGQIDALVHEITKDDASVDTHIMISVGYAAQINTILCQNTVYYTQAVENAEPLKPFVSVQTPMFKAIDLGLKAINSAFKSNLMRLNSVRMVTLPEAADAAAKSAMNGIRAVYMNTTVKADAATLKAAVEIYKSAIPSIKGCKGLIGSFTLQPYPVSLLKKSVEKGGNSLGLDPAEGPLVSVLLLTYWKSKSDDETIVQAMKGVIEKIKKDAAITNTLVPFTYLNYAANFQDPTGSYGEENKRALQEVSRKYDPEGLFQKACPGGFKLFPPTTSD
ncbi:FAD-binding domain-containing protein [Thozetella sp. PMI_491]|nr:FAD-binding domain-containing protein [Thozetella sp. PMI_491]